MYSHIRDILRKYLSRRIIRRIKHRPRFTWEDVIFLVACIAKSERDERVINLTPCGQSCESNFSVIASGQTPRAIESQSCCLFLLFNVLHGEIKRARRLLSLKPPCTGDRWKGGKRQKRVSQFRPVHLTASLVPSSLLTRHIARRDPPFQGPYLWSLESRPINPSKATRSERV